MRRFISTLVTLVWGLWFGGMVMVFIAVTSLFKTFPREVAGQGAAPIFHHFNAYQLALAAIALLATFAWRIVGPPRHTTWLFTFFALATLAACFVTMYLTPHIEALQHQGLTQSDDFKRYHGLSMATYSAETLALLIAGAILPWAHDPKTGT